MNRRCFTGHSAGSAGAILAAYRRRDQVKALFLEGCYADTETALMSLYYWVHPLFGKYAGPLVIATLRLLYGRDSLRNISPEVLAPDLDLPVMLIHGARGSALSPVVCPPVGGSLLDRARRVSLSPPMPGTVTAASIRITRRRSRPL